jgi:hypothetical protein
LYLTLYLIKEVNVAFGFALSKRSINRFVSLLLTVSLIGFGAFTPISAHAADFTLSGVVTPNTGSTAGGTLIDIASTGQNGGSTTVLIGGNACTGVNINTARIRCTTPAGSLGPKDIVVTQSSGSVTLTNGFTYASPPTVTGVEPNYNPLLGGELIDYQFWRYVATFDLLAVWLFFKIRC